MSNLIDLAESGRLPDRLMRIGMRYLCSERLQQERAEGTEAQSLRYQALLDDLRSSDIALHTDAANAKHYEVPPGLFRRR